MKIGLRTVKTGIAVGLTMVIAKALQIEYPFFAIVAALIAVQPTVSDSWRVGLNRILGTFIGAIVGVILVSVFPANFVFLGIGTIVLITIMNRLGWNEAINIAAFVLIAIFLDVGVNHISYALHRLFDTFIGISVAVLVNYLIYPPTYDAKVLEGIRDISKNMLLMNLYILDNVEKNKEFDKSIIDERLNLDQVEGAIEEAEKYIKLQVKEEKIKVYGDIKAKELIIIVKLAKENYQHLQHIIGVANKGVNKEVTALVLEDLESIQHQLNNYLGHEGTDFNTDKYFDFKSIMESIKRAKQNIKFNQEINKYPTEEVVKMLVYIYNLEESIAKFNIMANLYL